MALTFRQRRPSARLGLSAKVADSFQHKNTLTCTQNKKSKWQVGSSIHGLYSWVVTTKSRINYTHKYTLYRVIVLTRCSHSRTLCIATAGTYRYCHSIYHWASDCPDAPEPARQNARSRGYPDRGGSARRGARHGAPRRFWLGPISDADSPEPVIYDAVLLTGDEDSSKDRLLGETIGHCVVDSGCTRTVCGDVWLNTYLDSLTSRDRMSVYTTNSTCHFRFGDGEVYTSSRAVHIPVYIGSEVAVLTTQVVSANIPLLLSRDSLKKAAAHMNFQDDTINIFGVNIPMIISESGHCCLSLSRPLDSPNSPHTVMFTSPLKRDNWGAVSVKGAEAPQTVRTCTPWQAEKASSWLRDRWYRHHAYDWWCISWLWHL